MIEGYTKDLADWLGVGERRVRQLQQAEVLGRLPNGKYDVKVCIQATLRRDAEAGVEQDHRRIKRRTRPMLGFKRFVTARRTLAGIVKRWRCWQGIGARRACG